MTTLVKVEPVWTPQSQQTLFRAVLNALSFPGRAVDLSEPLAGSRAELGVLACLVDEMVTVADPDGLLSEGERRLLSPAAVAAPDDADYVVFDAALPPADGFKPRLGTLYRPEGGALLLLVCEEVRAGPLSLTLSGPGVETETALALTGVHPGWLVAREKWCDNFPTGADFVFCDRHSRIAAIPRTSRVHVNESSETTEKKGP